MKVLLDTKGTIHDSNGGSINELALPSEMRQLIEKIRQGKDGHFFKLPFSAVALIKDGVRVTSLPSHPSTFYPGSAFDTFSSIKQFVQDGSIVIPRVYLYPTSKCNVRCPICQFNSRRTAAQSIPWEQIEQVLDAFTENTKGLKTPSIIISGDGEPTMHPDFPKLLGEIAKRGIRIFLTSNWILPGRLQDEAIESVAKHVTMFTVSIKGLNQEAYNIHQGLSSGGTLERVKSNVERVVARMQELGRRDEVLVGMASLILPENTDSYHLMLQWCADQGLNYAYLNLVEPTYERWGIRFSDEQKVKTVEALSTLHTLRTNGLVIRHPRNPFEARSSVYYDATTRNQKDICGSALWNPLILPSKGGGSLVSCRNSDLFNDPNFRFTETLRGFSFSAAMSAAATARVMEATSHCRACRLERQAKTFDSLLTLARKHNAAGDFMLEFDLDLVARKAEGGSVAFEDTFESPKVKPLRPEPGAQSQEISPP